MNKRKKSLCRITSFLLIIALIFGGAGLSSLSGNEVYATGDGTATVRIIDSNNNEVITNSSISIESGVTTLGAVVASACQAEGRLFELNEAGFPSTIGGIAHGEGYSWMSMLNDSGASFNTGNFKDIAANDGDRIVLYANDGESNLAYSFFTIVTNAGVNVMQHDGTSYITGSLILKLETSAGGTVSPSTFADIILTDEDGNALIANQDFGLPPSYESVAITDDSGMLSIDLYGNTPVTDESDFEKIFIVSSNASGIVKPYCKIIMTLTGMTFSQPIDSTGYSPSEAVVSHTSNITNIVQALIDGIIDSSDSHSPDYYDYDWALGMSAAGFTPTQVEKNKFLIWLLNDLSKSSTTVARKAKAAIALTALNIDACHIPNKDTGANINLIEDVVYSTSAGIDATWSAPIMLSLYDLGNYLIPDDATITRELLINTIITGKGDDFWGTFGTQGTGMVLTALAPYYKSESPVNGISATSCAAITSVIDDAVAYLSSEMGEYGGFPGYEGQLESNTQAVVITGLNALGINPHTSPDFYKSASAMDNLLSYKTIDNKLGFTDNSSANDLASKQGMWALATYQNLSNDRSSNIFNFVKNVTELNNWPDPNLLTSIKVTAPTLIEYPYSESETSYSPDTSGMVVTGLYNGNASNTTNIAIELCTVSNIDLSKPGTQTVKVSYQGLNATFLVTVKGSDGTLPQLSFVSAKVKHNSNIIASSNSLVIENGKTSVLDVLKIVLDDACC